MVDLNGHSTESERIAHLIGGRLADGLAVTCTPPPRIGIGRFTLRGLPPALGGEGPVDIEATASAESDAPTVWLTRTSPEPRRCLGYVTRAHYHSYVPDLPEEAETALLERVTALWAEANRRGQVRVRRPPGLVRLALIVVDGLRVDLTWETGGDAVALAFRDLEPEHIGTVTGLDGRTPRLYPSPTHMDWATEPGRPERLIAAAAHAYDRA